MRNIYWRVQRRIARRALAVVVAILIVLAFWELFKDANAQTPEQCPTLVIAQSVPAPAFGAEEFVQGLIVDINNDGIVDMTSVFFGVIVGLQIRLSWNPDNPISVPNRDPVNGCKRICITDTFVLTTAWTPTIERQLEPTNSINIAARAERPCAVVPPRPTNLRVEG